ncbi:MAG: DUF4188 domain-containing protein [Polyangiaceae bacterium]
MLPTTQRVTALKDDGFAVFLIGMRINAWWKPWKWLPVGLAMPRMIQELQKQPELGFLGAESWFGRTTVMLSYWQSKEHLFEFASRRNSTHLPAWRAFYKAIGKSADVGIWHETYSITRGAYENVYVNMPPFGLGAVAGVKPAEGAFARARQRMAGGEPQALAAE